MRTKRSVLTVASLAAAGVAVGVLLAPTAGATTGDGKCTSTELCVFNDYGHNKSKGYYDLDSPALKNFHGRHYFNDGAYIGDSISSFIAGSGTSCAGYKVFVDVDFKGASLKLDRGTKGDLDSPFTSPYSDVISSYSKFGC
ncbi:hypothetical protein [Streptomyces sp. NPDC050534]|uniref:hypothetical protein n=1 Tax=Streptomyces sp. NPDC050534 TaxID=3365625 RepID=UPI0037AA27DE